MLKISLQISPGKVMKTDSNMIDSKLSIGSPLPLFYHISVGGQDSVSLPGKTPIKISVANLQNVFNITFAVQR